MIRTPPGSTGLTRSRSHSRILGLALGLACAPAVLSAQEDGADYWRFGVTVGSTSFAGLTVEYVRDTRAIDLYLGTWSFHDISVSIVGKQYIGQGRVQGFVGLGLWDVVAWQEEGVGNAFILRAPVGGQVGTFDDQDFGVEISLNRALTIKRADPEDDTPPRTTPIPLPGFYYKVKGR